jgi:hypothetical protein
MTAALLQDRAVWCGALARLISDQIAAVGLRIDAAAYLVRSGGNAAASDLGQDTKLLVSASFWSC